MYGLTDNELEKLCNLFRKHEEIEQAILYGSRAKGNFKPFPDMISRWWETSLHTAP